LQDSGPSRISKRSSQEAESSSPQATETSKPRRRSFKESRELEALNIDIPLLEAKRSNLEAALSGGDEDLTLLSQQLAELVETLHKAEERWLELSELVI
jgi:ATP-binding cassette subfamily F protein uup